MADKIGYDDSQFTFETVKDEAGDQLVFEEIGDSYTGEFLGTETITFMKPDEKGELQEESFLQIRFRDPSGPKAINAGYELEKLFTSGDIPVHTIVRLTLANKVDMGRSKNPMLSFRVETATPVNAGSQKK
jgi:hypothetical protein